MPTFSVNYKGASVGSQNITR